MADSQRTRYILPMLFPPFDPTRSELRRRRFAAIFANNDPSPAVVKGVIATTPIVFVGSDPVKLWPRRQPRRPEAFDAEALGVGLPGRLS